ncbi:Isoleucine--tRNA ligase [bioreactor metagenome]|uniref:Isoleucine--tRNA ligase n=1 Tax=bioreactor metagenome TaxID=1076179 RepID=A0A645FK47_9ZZZZ
MKKALELARTSKLIGSSLEANVELYCTGSLFDFLSSLAEELKTIFIVSGLSIQSSAAPKEAFCGEPTKGLAVVVKKAGGQKCDRCWVYSDTVGTNQEHPTLCDRCAKIVGE